MFDGFQVIFLICVGFTFIAAGIWGMIKRRWKQSLLVIVGLMCWGWLATWLITEGHRTDAQGNLINEETGRSDGRTD